MGMDIYVNTDVIKYYMSNDETFVGQDIAILKAILFMGNPPIVGLGVDTPIFGGLPLFFNFLSHI